MPKAIASDAGIAKGLDERIADSFAAVLPSRDIAELLREVTRADQDAKAASEEASAIALNPATRPEEVEVARKVMEDAQFKRLRMENATVGLRKLKSQAEARESAEIRRKELEAATAERDQLAKDLVEYDELARRIVALLVRLEASNRRIGDFNSAEIIARGAETNWPVSADRTLPALLHTVRLPKFRRDGTGNGLLWPR